MSEEYKELKEKLLMKKENGYDLLSAEERTKMEETRIQIVEFTL